MVKQAVESIAHSMLMSALSRVLVVLGTPAMIGVLAWFAGNFIALREMAAVQASVQHRLVAEVADLQTYRRDAFARGEAMRREDTQMRETMRDVQQALNRLSERLDRIPQRAPL